MNRRLDKGVRCGDRYMSVRLLTWLALVLLALHRATPHQTRCHRRGLSCSQYATQAFRGQGLVRGAGMALLYLADCRPAAGHRWPDDPRCGDGIGVAR
jgi:putative component of membrane protein insertase Oxa1/YidC/SpoIIIJ protein YidD